MRVDIGLDAGRQRSALRRLVRDRGPDASREVDHLKLASANGHAEELLDMGELGAATYGMSSALTDADGVLNFMLGVSTLGGDDTL